VCSFIGAQAPIDTKQTGGKNPLVELAHAIDIMGEQSDADRELEAMRGPRVADSIEDDPRFAKVAADPEAGQEAANGQGSYEGFMAMFGGGSPLPPGAGGEPDSRPDLREEAQEEYPELRTGDT
jgi:hypothetical protein